MIHSLRNLGTSLDTNTEHCFIFYLILQSATKIHNCLKINAGRDISTLSSVNDHDKILCIFARIHMSSDTDTETLAYLSSKILIDYLLQEQR